MAQDTDEERIRIKAHEIWESEGHPHGRDADHWAQAKEIVAIQDSLDDTLLPRDTGAQEPIEPTQAVEPYGDIPNLTDQGEHDLTSIDREPESTKPSHAVYTTGESIGHVARPARSDPSDVDDIEIVTPAPKVAAVTPTPSNPTLGSPAPRPAKGLGGAQGIDRSENRKCYSKAKFCARDPSPGRFGRERVRNGQEHAEGGCTTVFRD